MGLKICFIGAGNLATHLSQTLQAHGHTISEVYSRTQQSAQTLATLLNTSYTSSLKDIYDDADLYFVALKDSAVEGVLEKINLKNKLVVHCSGSLPISVLHKYSQNTGVLYPLQTFSKIRTVDFGVIPIFVEANSGRNETLLLNLAKSISKEVSLLNSDKRKQLHISAVFACNFVNHMYAVAAQYLEDNSISFDVLKPLILETAQKVQQYKPQDVQTGPAVRFDESIISDHLMNLNNNPGYRTLYEAISKSIYKFHQEKNK